MEPNKTNNNKRFSTAKIIVLLLLVAAVAIGGLLLFTPPTEPNKASVSSSGAINEGNRQVKVPIEIDTGGRTINAAEVRLTFDSKLVEVVKVTKEKSFIKLWITDYPSFSNKEGTIVFAGGVFNPGFKGKGQVGTVVLKSKSKQPVTTELRFASGTQVLLNDGKGTAVPLELSPIKVELP